MIPRMNPSYPHDDLARLGTAGSIQAIEDIKAFKETLGYRLWCKTVHETRDREVEGIRQYRGGDASHVIDANGRIDVLDLLPDFLGLESALTSQIEMAERRA